MIVSKIGHHRRLTRKVLLACLLQRSQHLDLRRTSLLRVHVLLVLLLLLAEMFVPVEQGHFVFFEEGGLLTRPTMFVH